MVALSNLLIFTKVVCSRGTPIHPLFMKYIPYQVGCMARFFFPVPRFVQKAVVAAVFPQYAGGRARGLFTLRNILDIATALSADMFRWLSSKNWSTHPGSLDLQIQTSGGVVGGGAAVGIGIGVGLGWVGVGVGWGRRRGR